MSTVNGKVAVEVIQGTRPAGLPLADQQPRQRDSLARTLWDAWKAYSHRAGGYQSQLLLSSVYFFVLGPSVIIARLTGTKLLDLDRKPRPTYWLDRPPAEKSLEALGRQF